MTAAIPKPKIVSVTRYGLIAYNGHQTKAEAFEKLPALEARTAELRREGWSVCPSMGLYWETHMPDGRRYLRIEPEDQREVAKCP